MLAVLEVVLCSVGVSFELEAGACYVLRDRADGWGGEEGEGGKKRGIF